MKQEKVVITGGSGLVGMQLTKLLKKGRFLMWCICLETKNSKGNVKVFFVGLQKRNSLKTERLMIATT